LKIIAAPNRVVDYVVVHELCHLRHQDHSPPFWKCLERVFHDYQECKESTPAIGTVPQTASICLDNVFSDLRFLPGHSLQVAQSGLACDVSLLPFREACW
jgi:hypothetical protein